MFQDYTFKAESMDVFQCYPISCWKDLVALIWFPECVFNHFLAHLNSESQTRLYIKLGLLADFSKLIYVCFVMTVLVWIDSLSPRHQYYEGNIDIQINDKWNRLLFAKKPNHYEWFQYCLKEFIATLCQGKVINLDGPLHP